MPFWCDSVLLVYGLMTRPLARLGSSKMNRKSTIFYLFCSQEKTKHLELFMVAFLQAYRAAKGDLNKISSFG